MVDFKFVSHLDEVLSKLGDAIQNSAEEIKEMAVEAVREKMLYGYHDPHGPDGHTEIVDTGRLYDSLEGDIKRASGNTYTVTVGTDVPYAKYVHNGTYKLKARPFIRDGLMEKNSEIKKIMENNLKNV